MVTFGGFHQLRQYIAKTSVTYFFKMNILSNKKKLQRSRSPMIDLQCMSDTFQNLFDTFCHFTQVRPTCFKWDTFCQYGQNFKGNMVLPRCWTNHDLKYALGDSRFKTPSCITIQINEFVRDKALLAKTQTLIISWSMLFCRRELLQVHSYCTGN